MIKLLKDKVLEIIGDRKNDVGVIVKDLDKEDWILKINENKIFPSASVIKIPIMLEVLNQIELGKYLLDEKIVIDNKDKVDFSMITELNVPEYSILDIMTLMIIISDNTATNILIDFAGYDNINNLMEKFEFTNTKLTRKMMDFEAIEKGSENTTTGMDMANILEGIYNEQIINKKHSKLAIDIMKRQIQIDSIPRYLEEDVVIANKTGELDGLNHDVGIIYSEKATYILGVFTENGKNNIINKSLIGSISQLVYDYFQKN